MIYRLELITGLQFIPTSFFGVEFFNVFRRNETGNGPGTHTHTHSRTDTPIKLWSVNQPVILQGSANENAN